MELTDDSLGKVFDASEVTPSNQEGARQLEIQEQTTQVKQKSKPQDLEVVAHHQVTVDLQSHSEEEKAPEPKQDVSPQKEQAVSGTVTANKSPIKAERLRQSPDSTLKKQKSQLSIAQTKNRESKKVLL